MAKASEEMNLKSPPTQSSPENPHPKAHGSEWAKDKQGYFLINLNPGYKAFQFQKKTAWRN